ncbi:MAG: 50S ribosomal protein L4 [Verrucomicrobia bacterium]|nr:50S ribosomal protein L4 [Verrucomicrobiota bacterium]
MKIPVRDLSGTITGEVDPGFALISDGRGTQAVHDSVVALLAARRRGTACTKTMGEVAGSGKKPWRQKGTGRARAGSYQSPLWRGGGVVFGPKPRDFSKKVNRQTQRMALRKALSDRLRDGSVSLLAELAVESPKTRELVAKLKGMGLTGSVLLVDDSAAPNLRLAGRNIPWLALARGRDLNAYEVLKYDHLLFTQSALAEVAKRLQ